MRPWFSKKNPPDEMELVAVDSDRGDEVKSFWEHLDDLRRTLLKSLGVLAITFNLALVFANRILRFLT